MEAIEKAIEPNIQLFFNEAGQITAACVTGLVGDVRPDDNRAICEVPYPRRDHFWTEG